MPEWALAGLAEAGVEARAGRQFTLYVTVYSLCDSLPFMRQFTLKAEAGVEARNNWVKAPCWGQHPQFCISMLCMIRLVQ